MDKGKLSGMMLLDLLNVFDIVDHSILLLKVKPIIYIHL